MSGVGRGLILLGLTVAVVIGASVPASATYADAVAVKTTISTTTVTAPTNVVGKLTCGSTATMSATWTQSTTARVSGYVVSVYFSDGPVQTVQLASTTTSWSSTIHPPVLRHRLLHPVHGDRPDRLRLVQGIAPHGHLPVLTAGS
jgi:hypothetical protein